MSIWFSGGDERDRSADRYGREADRIIEEASKDDPEPEAGS